MGTRSGVPSVLTALVAASFLAMLVSEYTSAGPGASTGAGKSSPGANAIAAADSQDGAKSQPQRLREGDTINQLGQVKVVGDRVLFQTRADEQFVLLENLLVQRMADMMKKTDEAVEWSVTGTVTEFYGKNFLLLTHAVRKTAPRPVTRPIDTPAPAKAGAPDPRAF